MAAKKKTNSRIPLTLSVIEDLRRKGYNQSEIAEMHGVSRQAVSWHKVIYNGSLTPREMTRRAWPWKTTKEHNRSTVYQRLRDLGEYMATGGKGMSYDKLQRLRSWLSYMSENDLVVEFDPAIPPAVGISPHGGFAYRKRNKKDGDLLIRVNEHTDLSEQGRMIWRMPPKLP